MSKALNRALKGDREGKEAMHRRLEELKANKKKPLIFVVDEEEADQMASEHVKSPLQKHREQQAGLRRLKVPWQMEEDL